MSGWEILQGDALALLREMPAASVDAIVTDPPYALGFMGKAWDSSLPGVEVWTEARRVAKPGAHLVAFGGSRTYHRLACAIEDAGWEVRDCLMWLYGSGFPKSLDVSKAIDKAAGAVRAVREVREVRVGFDPDAQGGGGWSAGRVEVSSPATDAARQWAGWGTALKPAHEPIILARKPLSGTVAANVLENGTGALNVDGCRIAAEPRPPITGRGAIPARNHDGAPRAPGIVAQPHDLGRWPANVLLDEEAAAALDKGGDSRFFFVSRGDGCVACGSVNDANASSNPPRRHVGSAPRDAQTAAGSDPSQAGQASIDGFGLSTQHLGRASDVELTGNTDTTQTMPTSCASCGSALLATEGSTSPDGAERAAAVNVQVAGTRFWYSAKASAGERHAMGRNSHPTVKPVDLMRWLCRLVTPRGGLVLDPFMGSGSTGVAALAEGFRFLGLEREADYCAMARRRIAGPLFAEVAQ